METWGKCDFLTEEERAERETFKNTLVGRITESVHNFPVTVIIKPITTEKGFSGMITWGRYADLVYGETVEEIMQSIDRHCGRYAGKDRLIIFSDVCPDPDPEDPESEYESTMI